MAFSTLCPPALVYLVFSVTQIVIDTVKGQYNTAMFKLLISLPLNFVIIVPDNLVLARLDRFK